VSTQTAPVLVQEVAAGTLGAGTVGANSYVSQAQAVQYAANVGNKTFTNASDADQLTALIRAAQGIDFWLTGRWHGRRASVNQPMQWPRYDVRDAEGFVISNTGQPGGMPSTGGGTQYFIPQKLMNAQCEVAIIELTTPFIQKKVDRYDAVQAERAGPINVSFKATAPSITYWPQIIAMLKDYATIGVMPVELVIGLTKHERDAMRGDREHYANPFDFPDYFHLIKEAVYNPGYDAPWLV